MQFMYIEAFAYTLLIRADSELRSWFSIYIFRFCLLPFYRTHFYLLTYFYSLTYLLTYLGLYKRVPPSDKLHG